MTSLTSSVLIPSFKRGQKLRNCLMSLNSQTRPAGEVIVVWQADDTATRDLVESCRAEVGYPLQVLHCEAAGVVPAENTALDASTGQVILLIDDDAVAPPDWVARHLAFYEKDARCGAVGGPAYNFYNGVPGPRRSVEPVGLIYWYGSQVGNMYDHPDEWKSRSPRRVNHLVGYNMSLRRSAFDRFEIGLKAYWQKFEADACLQVQANGYDVWFDFSNIVDHHSSNEVYKPGREGNLTIKVYNGAFNEAFVLSKFSPWRLRLPRFAYMVLIGTTSSPGIAACLYGMRKYGQPLREVKILLTTWRFRLAGWRAGKKARPSRTSSRPVGNQSIGTSQF